MEKRVLQFCVVDRGNLAAYAEIEFGPFRIVPIALLREPNSLEIRLPSSVISFVSDDEEKLFIKCLWEKFENRSREKDIQINYHRPCRWFYECGKTTDIVLRLA